tara:strand:- start:127150 stop:129804 length:2655 start_codon:yes stop_codon:yes gene_type:complete
MKLRTGMSRLLIAGGIAVLAGCSAGSGGGGSEREVDLDGQVGSSAFVYDGPAPASDEVQQFKRTFYDQLAGNDRCGECHTPGKTGNPFFVDQQNVNNAWQAARSIVSLNDPAASEAVLRVANGHNCWLAPGQEATCATTITGYIERWAAGAEQSSATVQLSPREPFSPTGTRVLPPSSAELSAMGLDILAGGELLDLLYTYCSDCHSDTASIPQVPYFASADEDIAYTALRGKVDLANPAASRVVLRLDPEGHNCWSDCADNAGEIRAAVSRISDVVPVTEVDPALLTSMAQVLERDGIVATAGGRFETSLIAKWEFREGTGSTTADTSGVQPEVPLTLSGQYSWMASWGVRFENGKAQGGVSGSAKLFDRITATGEYSIEAWVAPANVAQEMAWIAGYAGGPDSRNMLLSQSLYNYEAFNRSTVTDANNAGEPALTTGDDAELAQATLQHVVVTYNPVDGRRIYVNGIDSGEVDPSGGGLLNNWSESFAVVLGNTTANNRPWAGAMRMVAIHNSALTAGQVLQNFDIGVGQKYYLLFSVSELLDREGQCHVIEAGERTNYCYVVFESSQFDDSSYLFNQPFFVNLNPDGGDVSFDLRGIRLGINGKLADNGQGFVNVAATVDSATAGQAGQRLSAVGSIIPLENGADQDLFFLSFDALGSEQGVVDDGQVRQFQPLLTGVSASRIGLRTFDEINATLSRLTGVSVANSVPSNVTGKTVSETFASVRRALPGIADFQAFMSSHQMAATQLAAAYCDALVQDTALRASVFPGFDFNRAVADPGIDWRDTVAAPLVDRSVNSGLLSAADRSAMLDEIELLITDDRDLKPYIQVGDTWVSDPDPAAHTKRDGLIYCAGNATCPASRTADVVKAACTTVLGSAVTLMQ